MLTRLLRLIPVAPIAFVCLGCHGGAFSFNFHDSRPVRVKHVHTRARHVCTHDCHDCYWDGDRVVFIKGHRHHANCGHRWNGRDWVVVRSNARPVSPKVVRVHKAKHVHGPACGCAYDRHSHKWVKVRKGHRHRPGCGHVYVDGRWSFN